MKYIYILMSIFISTYSFAQITLNSSNFVEAGDVIIMSEDSTVSDNITIGNSGPNQTWDFSSLNLDENAETIEFIEPSTTPNASDFPEANLAIDMDEEFIYISNSSSGVSIVGFVYDGMTLPINQKITEWPMEYGNTFSDDSNLEIVMEFSESEEYDSLRIKETTSILYDIDAWGTVITPSGEFDALRMKKTKTNRDSSWYKTPASSSTILASGYMIFSPGELTVNAYDTVYFENLGLHDAVEVSQETWENNEATSNGGFAYDSDGYHIFTEPGTYYYVCTPHIGMNMKGMITVTDEWTLFEDNEEAPTTSYEWWTNDIEVRYPLVSFEMEEDGNIDNVSYVNVNTSSVNEIQFDFSIYPNPSAGIFNLKTSNHTALELQLTVLNSLGQEVYAAKTNGNNETKIDLSSQSSGVYLLSIQSEKGVNYQHLIIE